MRTLLRHNSSFGGTSKPKSSRFSEYLSDNSSRTSFQKPAMTRSSTSKSKRWFSPPSLSKKKTIHNVPSPQQQQQQQQPPHSQLQPQPPTYMPERQPKPSKRKKAWQATKSFLFSLGEPPTAEYERQQAALRAQNGADDERGDGKKVGERNGREAFGAVNYGPYHQGGPWNGERL